MGSAAAGGLERRDRVIDEYRAIRMAVQILLRLGALGHFDKAHMLIRIQCLVIIGSRLDRVHGNRVWPFFRERRTLLGLDRRS